MTPGERVVAVLFCDPKGVYSQIEGVELWGEQRDARKYAGPHPVICHPPCARWGRFAAMTERLHGLKRGDDGGCFATSIAAVQRCGGVLEHPAYTDAWKAFGLFPPTHGGWQQTFDGAWVCHIEQGHYGHIAPKPTWLYAVGCELPQLKWGPCHLEPVVGNTGAKGGKGGRLSRSTLAWATRRERSGTPRAFADLLVAMARSATPGERGGA